MCLAEIQLLAFLESQELREGRASWLCNKVELRRAYRRAAEQSSSHRPRRGLAKATAADWEILHPRLSPATLCLKALSLSPHKALIALQWHGPEVVPHSMKTRGRCGGDSHKG